MDTNKRPSSPEPEGAQGKRAKLDDPILIQVRVEFLSICSVFHGKHILPKTLVITYPKDGAKEIKTLYLNPGEFVSNDLNPVMVSKTLENFGYNDDMTMLTLNESVIGENICESERLECVTTQEETVTDILATISAVYLTSVKPIILSFDNRKTKNFFLSLFLGTNRTLLIELVKEIVLDEIYESLTYDLMDYELSVSELSTQVLVDATIFKCQSEKLSYSQLIHLRAFCNKDTGELLLDLESNPIVTEAANTMAPQSKEVLTEVLHGLKKSRSDAPKLIKSEREMFARFCSFLSECCSCHESGYCDVSLVPSSSFTLVPVLLSKAKEFNMEKEFFQHIVRHVEITPALPRIEEINNQILRQHLYKHAVQLVDLSSPVSSLQLKSSDLKSGAKIWAKIIESDHLQCKIFQACRVSSSANLTLNFSKTNGVVDSSNETAGERRPNLTHQIIFMGSIGKYSLCEIQPEPTGKWSYAKFTVLKNSGIPPKGTTNVFKGKFIIIPRETSGLPEQPIGVCQFVRPSTGKTQCGPPCTQTYNLSPLESVILNPDCTSTITVRSGEEDPGVKLCTEANHVLRVIEVSHPDLIVVEGYVEAGNTINLKAKNVSETPLTILPVESVFKVECCFNEKQVDDILSYCRQSNCCLIEPQDYMDEERFLERNGQAEEDLEVLSVGSDENLYEGSDLDDDVIEINADDDDQIFNGSNLRAKETNVDCIKCNSREREPEKCPDCPEYPVTLTLMHDQQGICVARIVYPDGIPENEVSWVKFFSQDYSVMCPSISEVVNKEHILVYHLSISSGEEVVEGDIIGTCQIITTDKWLLSSGNNSGESKLSRGPKKTKSRKMCNGQRMLHCGESVILEPHKMREVELTWGKQSQRCSHFGHFQKIKALSNTSFNCYTEYLPFHNPTKLPLMNRGCSNIFINKYQTVVATECAKVSEIVEKILESYRDKEAIKQNAKQKVIHKPPSEWPAPRIDESVLYASGYLFPMSPGLLNPEHMSDEEEIQELDIRWNAVCKKSCLGKNLDWSTFCTSCPQYSLLTINATILPTDGSYVTLLCRMVGPLLDDVEECPKCIALFPSTTHRAIFQAVPSIREVLLCGNNAFVYVTISTRTRCVIGNRELASGALLGFGQKRRIDEAIIGDGQCLWPLKVKLESPDSEPLVIESDQSTKVRASYSVPTSHQFDPVSVEFNLAYEQIGNEDLNFMLQGDNDIILPFQNKEPKSKSENFVMKTIELKHGAVLGNLRLLTDQSSVNLGVSNRSDLPTQPVRFIDTNGCTSCLKPVVAAQNVSVLKNASMNVICRIQDDDQSKFWEESLRHVILLNPKDPDAPWGYKSKLISPDSVETSDKFFIQLQNLLNVTNHLRIDDPVAQAKIFVGLDINTRYELFKVVGRIPVTVAAGGLFTLQCDLVRWSGYENRSKPFKVVYDTVELVARFDACDDKNIDLMSETLIIDTMTNKHKSKVFFQVMARNDSDEILQPQFVEVGLARGLTRN